MVKGVIPGCHRDLGIKLYKMINRKLLLFFDHCEAAAFHVESKVFGKYNIGAWSEKFITGSQVLFFSCLILAIYIVSEQSLKLPFPVFAVPIFVWGIYFLFVLDGSRKTTQEEKLDEFLKLRKGVRILFYFISFTPLVLFLAFLAFLGIKYLRTR